MSEKQNPPGDEREDGMLAVSGGFFKRLTGNHSSGDDENGDSEIVKKDPDSGEDQLSPPAGEGETAPPADDGEAPPAADDAADDALPEDTADDAADDALPDDTADDAAGDDALPEDSIGGTEGESQTGQLVDGPGNDDPDPDPKAFDLATCLLIGASLAFAVAAAVLAVLLARTRRKAAGKAAPFSGKITVGKLHEIGGRESQQDCFAVSPEELASTRGMFAVVADGMGGLADGDKVSHCAVTTMLDGFFAASGAPEDALLALVQQANSQVNQLLGANIGKSGSTVVASLIWGGKFHYVSVGDSRICLFRDGQLIQLNREHIYRHELSIQAVNGNGTLQAAASHAKAAGLTSYLGMGQLKYVDIPAEGVTIRSGDKFILMSDGVYNALTEEEMSAALKKDAREAADLMSAMIAGKAYRHQDNYTAVILAC